MFQSAVCVLLSLVTADSKVLDRGVFGDRVAMPLIIQPRTFLRVKGGNVNNLPGINGYKLGCIISSF